MLFEGLPSIARWAEQNGLRLTYLHLVFLGFVSLTLVALARETFGTNAFHFPCAFQIGVLVVLASLIPMIGLWPIAMAGRWMLYTAAIAAGILLVLPS